MCDQNNNKMNNVPMYSTVYNNNNCDEICPQDNFVATLDDFSSPIIPHIQPQRSFEYGGVFTSDSHCNVNQQRIDKSHWICDYSDDIFQTLRETELKRHMVCFRSQQVGYRPMLLKLLKEAIEKHKLARTTLHLAVYLLDCFMDNYTIRADKLNLTAITCLIVASKIEEADMDMPKFAELNKLVNEVYTLYEFKNVECKVLVTFNFDLIRPTAATFAEYFANCFITLQDYHMFINHWNNEMLLNNYHHQQEQQQLEYEQQINFGPGGVVRSCSIINTPSPYNSYEDMLTTLSKTFFELIDVSLSYLKFANARPSIIASACIAAVRQMHGIFPIWTPYLIKLTACTADIISPFVEAILALYRIHCNHERIQQGLQQTPNTPIAGTALNTAAILCDSPDSGIVSANDTKSMKSDTDNEDDYENLNDDGDDDDDADDIDDIAGDDSEEEDEPYHCMEYPILPKRRRIF